METIETSTAWFRTDSWNLNPARHAAGRQTVTPFCRAPKNSGAKLRPERVFLFITDPNPELEELSLQFA